MGAGELERQFKAALSERSVTPPSNVFAVLKHTHPCRAGDIRDVCMVEFPYLPCRQIVNFYVGGAKLFLSAKHNKMTCVTPIVDGFLTKYLQMIFNSSLRSSFISVISKNTSMPSANSKSHVVNPCMVSPCLRGVGCEGVLCYLRRVCLIINSIIMGSMWSKRKVVHKLWHTPQRKRSNL